MCAVGHDSSLDMKSNYDYMAGDPSISIKVFSQEANNIDNIKVLWLLVWEKGTRVTLHSLL